MLPPQTRLKKASIGRVISLDRHKGYGSIIMKEAIKLIKEKYNVTEIEIGAQVYAKKFYENLGFKQISDTYLEDNIPHIYMIKEI